MKLETFFDKFDQFADAPDAVEKMRELVLELAVKGALSERHASDQDVAAWREFVTKLDHRSCDSDTGAEPPFEIPAEWRWVCLDDLGTTRVRNDVEDNTRVSFVPMALISSTYGVAVQSEERTWSEIKKGFTHFADGDVVMAKITPCFENAKSAVMRNLINGVGAGTTELHVFRRGTGLVLPEFVLLYVKTRGFITRGEPRMTGSAGQKRVPREYFAASPFPLPPLAEQKRIMAKVDELMALCDRLEAQQKERETRHAELARASLVRFADVPTPANLNFIFHTLYDIPPADLRKSILTLAVQGKLVPQDPNDEPAGEMLARLEAHGGNEKVRRGVSIEVLKSKSVEEEILPGSWVIESTARLLKLGAILDLKDGNHGVNHPKVAEFTETGLPFITAAQVSDNGMIDYEGAYKVSGGVLKRLRVGLALPGDVIYTHKGSVGRVAICDRECVLTPQTTYYRLNNNVLNSGFIRAYLLSPLFRDQVDLVKRQTTRDFVSINAQYQFFLRVPPIAEQGRIVMKLNQLMALVDALETLISASNAMAVNLLCALVSELTTSA